MGKFLQGLMIGTAAGLLIAPMRGKELRNKVRARFEQIQERTSSSNRSLRSKLYKYESTLEEMDYEPLILPVETFEEPKPSSASNAMPSSSSTANFNKNVADQGKRAANSALNRHPGDKHRQH